MTFIYQSFVHSCGNVKQNIYIYFTLPKNIYLFYQPILEIHSTFQFLFAIWYIKKGNVNKYYAVPVKIFLYGSDLKKKEKSCQKIAKSCQKNYCEWAPYGACKHNPIKNNFLSQFLTQ